MTNSHGFPQASWYQLGEIMRGRSGYEFVYLFGGGKDLDDVQLAEILRGRQIERFHSCVNLSQLALMCNLEEALCGRA